MKTQYIAAGAAVANALTPLAPTTTTHRTDCSQPDRDGAASGGVGLAQAAYLSTSKYRGVAVQLRLQCQLQWQWCV